MGYNYGKKRTLQEAQSDTDSYVEPRECFIWFVNNQWGWQSFSSTGDTPCAHYVSHQLGLTTTSSTACRNKYVVRVSDLVARLNPVPLAEVEVGDVWARLKNEARAGGGKEPSSHCGLVLKVDRSGSTPVITIKHCSSGQKKVAENDWTKHFGGGGKFYRLPKNEVSPEAHANLRRFERGFAYQLPFSSNRSV